ncbi:hypothetical protein R5R35_007529 [Gryllus longicercus]|uniref:Uncharacterized protein n=1 Tax=Gryllus longicercus TaxID=2509291 RepID=A0AAN9YZN1_9ORTH
MTLLLTFGAAPTKGVFRAVTVDPRPENRKWGSPFPLLSPPSPPRILTSAAGEKKNTKKLVPAQSLWTQSRQRMTDVMLVGAATRRLAKLGRPKSRDVAMFEPIRNLVL